MIGKEILRQMKPYQQGKQTKEIQEMYELDRVIKLASNENPYGYSKNVQQFLKEEMHALNIYPDGYSLELRNIISEKLQIDKDQLVFGSGSDELIQIICRTFLYPGVNTVMGNPTFTQYKHHSLIEGAEIREIPVKNGHHDLEGMFQAVDSNTKILWICSPDNPSGTVVDANQLKQFIENCPKECVIVIDEAYIEYMDEDERPNTLDWVNEFDQLILLRTFSKAYGLAALRIGYSITSKQIANQLNIVRGPFNTNAIAQEAATIAYKDQDFIKETVEKNNQVKKSFEQFLMEIKWEYYPSQTNFLLVKTPISGTKMFEYFIRHGFIVRPGELLGYPNTIRITIGKEKDMELLKEVIQEFRTSYEKEV